MKIYDCFTFYNEFELLDLRIAEIYDQVDVMVIVEANQTFQNNPKPLYLRELRSRYQHLDKLRVISLSDMPGGDPWANERHQRDAIIRGLDDAAPEDIIMISDADEIPRPSTIEILRNSTADVFGFRMPIFNFKYNYMLINQDCYSVWSGACRRRALDSAEDFRRSRHSLNHFSYGYNDGTVHLVEHAGWHFTYLGTEEFARTKIQSFAHTETNRPEIIDQLNIEDSIRKGTGIIRTDKDYRFNPVMMDDYMPVHAKNPDYIISDAGVSARNYLPG